MRYRSSKRRANVIGANFKLHHYHNFGQKVRKNAKKCEMDSLVADSKMKEAQPDLSQASSLASAGAEPKPASSAFGLPATKARRVCG
jgi:hypothetical protein